MPGTAWVNAGQPVGPARTDPKVIASEALPEVLERHLGTVAVADIWPPAGALRLRDDQQGERARAAFTGPRPVRRPSVPVRAETGVSHDHSRGAHLPCDLEASRREGLPKRRPSKQRIAAELIGGEIDRSVCGGIFAGSPTIFESGLVASEQVSIGGQPRAVIVCKTVGSA